MSHAPCCPLDSHARVASSLFFLTTTLVLLLMPRSPPPSAVPADDGKLTDISTVLRVTLASVAALSVCCACCGVLCLHCLVKQKALLVNEPEPAELPRWLVPAAVVLVIAVAGLAAWLNAA